MFEYITEIFTKPLEDLSILDSIVLTFVLMFILIILLGITFLVWYLLYKRASYKYHKCKNVKFFGETGCFNCERHRCLCCKDYKTKEK